jgi:NADH:ubiquinone oxidoreductase subunit E
MTELQKEKNLSQIIDHAILEHGATREALIPVLSEVNQAYGYIPKEAFAEIQRQLHSPENRVFVSESQLFGLASFYQMLSTQQLGRHVIRYCESAPCHVMGGRQLVESLKEHLQLEPGCTSPDGKWSLINTSCLGVCGVGPVILIDEDIYGNLTPDQIPSILSQYE